MPTYQTSDFERALRRKGFVEDLTHHRMFWYYIDGIKSAIRTRTSHNERQFGEHLFELRRKQMHISRQQMIDFIACSLTEKEYREHLVAGKHVTLTVK